MDVGFDLVPLRPLIAGHRTSHPVAIDHIELIATLSWSAICPGRDEPQAFD
jgi:hypothetical protein